MFVPIFFEKVNNFRNKYSNKFEIFEAAEQAGLTIGILSSLIQAGALEGFSQSRSKVVLEAQLWNLLTKREKRRLYFLTIIKILINKILSLKEMILLSLIVVLSALMMVFNLPMIGTLQPKVGTFNVFPYYRLFELCLSKIMRKLLFIIFCL